MKKEDYRDAAQAVYNVEWIMIDDKALVYTEPKHKQAWVQAWVLVLDLDVKEVQERKRQEPEQLEFSEFKPFH